MAGEVYKKVMLTLVYKSINNSYIYRIIIMKCCTAISERKRERERERERKRERRVTGNSVTSSLTHFNS